MQARTNRRACDSVKNQWREKCNTRVKVGETNAVATSTADPTVGNRRRRWPRASGTRSKVFVIVIVVCPGASGELVPREREVFEVIERRVRGGWPLGRRPHHPPLLARFARLGPVELGPPPPRAGHGRVARHASTELRRDHVVTGVHGVRGVHGIHGVAGVRGVHGGRRPRDHRAVRRRHGDADHNRRHCRGHREPVAADARAAVGHRGTRSSQSRCRTRRRSERWRR